MSVFTVLAENLKFPEGPVSMPDGSVLVVELARGTLTRVGTDGSVRVVAELGGAPNGAAIGPDGAAYITNCGGNSWHLVDGLLYPGARPDDFVGGSIQRVDLETGEVRTLYRSCGDNPLNGPNDLVFDRTGHFYFTDHGKSHDRMRDHGVVYYASPDGRSIEQLIYPLLTPNGIALDADETTLYVAETAPGRVLSFPLARPGVLADPVQASGIGLLRNPVASLHGRVTGLEMLDSIAVDAAGRICAGLIDAPHGGIAIFSGAREMEVIRLPDPVVTNLCFDVRDSSKAYVTLSASGRLVSVPWPSGG